MTNAQLEVFSILAELRGFTATARHLGISQSAVSQALKALEEHLGVPLFDRRGAVVELTSIGERLLVHAREILGVNEAMRQEAKSHLGLHSGSLRIGSFGPSSTSRLLPPILALFCKKYPDIAIYIDEGSDETVIKWLQERRIDIGFVIPPDERFETHELIEDQLVAVLPKDSPLAKQKTIHPFDLCSFPFALTGAGSGNVISKVFSDAKLFPDVRYRTSQVASTIEIVSRGDAVAILSEHALPAVKSSQEYHVRPLEPRHARLVGLALNSGEHTSPATLAFLDLAKRQYRR